MRNLLVLMQRELHNYFYTPIAYVFLLIFLFAAGMVTFYFGNFFVRGQADLVPFFNAHPWLYLLFVPALTMRIWPEERKSGTIELLLTLPISLFEAVFSKFLACWLFIGVSLLATTPLWLVVTYLGKPDHGVIVASYIGSFLMAGSFISIGCALSVLTKNQVIAFISTIFVLIFFNFLGYRVWLEQLPGWVPQIMIDYVSSFSFVTNFEPMVKGLLEVSNVVYFILVILFSLWANVLLLEAKKADQ